MKRILTLLLLFCLNACSKNETNCNYVTDYYPKIYEAELNYYQKNYEKAFELYQAAFNSCLPKNTPIHYEIDKYAEIAAILGKEELALKFLKIGIAKGNELKWIHRDSVFDSVLNSENGKKFISQYEEMRADYLFSVDLELRKELQRMIELDQKHNMTPSKDSMFQANDKRLAEIFEEYGYPNGQIIGTYNIDRVSSDPTILLLHTSDSIRLNYFLPKIEKYVRNGEASPLVLATMYDNLEFFNGNPQTHGTYGDYHMISPISKVNANRKSIGLPTLEMTKKLDSLRLQ